MYTYITNAPKPSNDVSAYKSKIKLYLGKLKNGQVENVTIDLTKRTTKKTLATQLGLLSNDMKMPMVLPSINRHHALNDRTLNLLRQGNIDLSAIIGGSAEPNLVLVTLRN